MLSDYPFYEIGAGAYEINEFDGASMFLVVGSSRALLIDTGVGIGALDDFVRRLTPLPVEVLLTHNHRDHVGNAPRFSRVYMDAADIRMGPLLRPLTTRESRLEFAHGVCARHPGRTYPWTDGDAAEFSCAPELTAVGDGQVFDLGGRRLQCVATPGHTPGSLSVIDSRTGILFCGDACNGTLGLGVRPIPGQKHATMEQSHAALMRLAGMPFDRAQVFNGHTDCRQPGQPLPEGILPSVLEAMELVLDGKAVSQPKHIAGIHADVEVVHHGGVELQFHSELIR